MKHARWSGVDVELRVDGVPLEEFDNNEDNSEKPDVTKYVEVISGANFTINVKLSPSRFRYYDNDLAVAIYMDGKWATTSLCSRNTPSLYVDGVVETHSGRNYLRKFMFSELRTSDGPVAASLVPELKQLGTVSVGLIRCVKTAYRGTGDHDRSSKLTGGDTIPEKGLKGRAISNRVSLGEKEKTNVSYASADYPWGSKPFAVFNFKYRSHKDLQIEGIIERSPSPPPLEERDVDTLTPTELRELLRHRNEELEGLARVKREGVKRERSTTIIDGGDDDDEVAITGAGPSKRRRTSNDSGIDVVDLTED